MAERSRRPLHLPALLIVVVALVLALGPAGAARGQTAATPPVLALRSQTAWWSPGQPFVLALAVDAPDPAAVELAVSVYPRLGTRIAFTNTLEGRLAGRPVAAPTVLPLADVPTDEAGDRAIALTPDLRTDGVYPVRVELRPAGGGTALAAFVTHLVHVPAVLPGDKLDVATVLPVHAPPAVAPDGSIAIDDQRAESLASLAAGLDAHPDVALTLAPTPDTIEALGASPRDQDRSTLASLVAALPGRQLVGGPFVPTNLTAMIDAGLEGESAAQLTRGTTVLRSRFGADPITATRIIDERLTDAAIAHLQSAQQVTKLVVPEALLTPIARNLTLTGTFGMESRRGPVAAAMADAGLTAHFAAKDPVLGAHQLLADLAVIYNDQPEVLRRGAVVLPSRAWEPSATFLDALLGGLETSPILAPVGIDAFFDQVGAATSGSGSRATPLVRTIGAAPAGAPTPSLPADAVRAARSRIEAFASAVDPSAEAGQAVLDRLDRSLLAAESSDLRARDRTRYFAGVDEQLDHQIAAIAMPQNRSITLTAREGEIPVTITSRVGYPVRVVLRVVSDTLDFPEGATRDLTLARENTTAQFAVRAQSSGSFPLRVRIETPEGLVLAESRFTVRSTAISGVGTALSIGAALFLVVWWANHLRGRRSKRLVPA